MAFKIFVINPGSTSTKLALFENRKMLFETSVVHDAKELLSFPTINDQLPYRMAVIKDFLKENNIDLTGVDGIVGRGGSIKPVKSGVYEVNDKLLEDTRNAVGGVVHPSSLGIQLGYELQQEYGGRLFMVDPISVDEYIPEARYTGIAGIRRKSVFHALNLKGTLHHHCEMTGTNYPTSNFILCHIDGGVSVVASEGGRIIDGNNACGGDGPFTPTRTGSIGVLDLLDYLEAGHSIADTRRMCAGKGGFVSYYDSNDADELKERIVNGDKQAKELWSSFIYNICKSIGAMACALGGKVDGIILTGRYVRFDDMNDEIKRRCEWIAPIHLYNGELEHQAMADGAYWALAKKYYPRTYE